MNHHDKIQELRKAHIREVELMGELRAFLKSNTQRIRKYQDDQLVEVFDEENQSLGNGIIDCAFSAAAYLDSLEIKKYAADPKRWNTDLNFILYRVNKVKADGSKSSHKLAVCSETRTKGNSYFLIPY